MKVTRFTYFLLVAMMACCPSLMQAKNGEHDAVYNDDMYALAQDSVHSDTLLSKTDTLAEKPFEFEETVRLQELRNDSVRPSGLAGYSLPESNMALIEELPFDDDDEMPIIDTINADSSRTFVPMMHVKTNLIGWAFGVTNVAWETDLCSHLSLNIPFYYSGYNYFKHTIKFRTYTLQPELRYWFDASNNGWYLAAHFGVGWFNVAWGNTYRYQDHNNLPALGGGLAFGYRMDLPKNWRVEFSLGAGVYGVTYDRFRNVENGFLVDTQKKAFCGIDQASISFAYSFNIKKKGGQQ